MYSNRNIAKYMSVLLMVIMLQKAGGGLYLHNLLHNQGKHYFSETGFPGVEKDGTNCSCIDDFNLPFAAADQPVFAEIAFYPIENSCCNNSSVCLPLVTFFSLRAPPAQLG